MSSPHMLFMPQSSCGIYHLMRAGRVVYVGQTTNLLARIGSHVTKGIQFDAVAFYACDVRQLNEREEMDLARLRPELNREGVTRPYRVMPGQVWAQQRYLEAQGQREVNLSFHGPLRSARHEP